jgi:hypothetical protein
MRLLRNLTRTHLSEGKDLSELPYDVLADIKSNIRKGAADLEQEWANALHLVHKAYQVEAAERPDPSMKAAWKQYEESIEYAVQQLLKYRGLDGEWRMSSAMFHVALERQIKFRVTSEGGTSGQNYTVMAKSLNDVVDSIKAGNTGLVDITDHRSADGQTATLRFAKWGIERNHRLVIEPAFKN